MRKHSYLDSGSSTFKGEGFNSKIPLLFICLLALAVPAFATHTAAVTLSPTWTNCGADETFTANVENTGGDPINEVRIYKTRNNNYTTFSCGTAPSGWSLDDKTSTFGYCQYETEESNEERIDEGEDLDFTFPVTGIKNESTYEWEIKTYDIDDAYLRHFPTMTVDCRAPITTKTYGTPFYNDGSYDYITTSTPITLTAVDQTPHPSGVAVTQYRNFLVPDEICRETCHPEFYGEYGLEVPWIEYSEPFYKKEESCHVIEYYSADNQDNTEALKWQCVFVDTTPPVLTKRVGYPQVECEGEECDYYITQNTAINLSCSDQQPHPSNNVTIYWSYTVDGGSPVTGNHSGSEYNLYFPQDSEHVLEAWCKDAIGNESQHDVETFKVDSMPPSISKTMIGTGHLGECPPGPSPAEPCYVRDDGQNGVSIWVEDNETYGHAVDDLYCEYKLLWEATEEECEEADDYDDGRCLIQYGEFSEQARVIFEEDSKHELYIYCEDALGNRVEDVETFLVDSTPPETTKSYGEPFVAGLFPKYCDNDAIYPLNGDGYNGDGCGWAEWINTETPISLSAEDEKAGVAKTYWRNLRVFNGEAAYYICGYPETYCNPNTYMQNVMNPEEPWNVYDGSFHKREESCHVIEYYSIDKLGNEEELNWQCVFVDETAPEVDKVIGDPVIAKGEDNYISQQTPITLSCQDIEPHPVDHVSLWYRYRFADDCSDFGEAEWTDWIDPNGHVAEKTIYFNEDSCHELEYYCKDGLGNATSVYSEIDIVDTQGPVITKEIVGPKSGDCPPEEEGDECYIDGATEIRVNAYDPLPHPVNDVYCDWEYEVLDNEGSGGEEGVTPPFVINFPEESKHLLTITCYDALKNKRVDKETFFVDKTPPSIWKEYSEPYERYDFQDYWAEWITSNTQVYAGAYDSQPHPSGVKEVAYRATVVDDEYCRHYEENDEFECKDAVGSGSWTSVGEEDFEEFEFKIETESSCHLIEIKATDNVDKNALHKQCVFVDNTPPTPVKEVGKPKEEWHPTIGEITTPAYKYLAESCWNGENPLECWKVTMLTPIKLGCVDLEPHPVDNETVCFNVEVDGEDATEEYCGTELNEDGYCCLESTTDQFYFGETTEHNLKYYCVDALGNKGPIDDEKFKVDETAFEIQLNKKWNLISVPVSLLSDSIDDAFNDVADTVEAVWTYDAVSDQWFVYTPDGVPENDSLDTMLPGWGYWVLSNSDDMLVIGGSLFRPGPVGPPTKSVVKGWNLIGYYGADGQEGYYGPGGNGKTARCELLTLLESWLDLGFNSLLTYWGPDNPDMWKPLDRFYRMDPGAGYWLYTNENGFFAPPTACDP